MKYFLGIDFGGGASKATLLCEDGTVSAVSTTEYKTYYPKFGYAEQNPDDWVTATCTNIRSILDKSGVCADDICAMSLDAATHTAVLTDGNFDVIRPAVYWTDTRSIEEVQFLKENYLSIIEEQAFHTPSTIWTLPEILWVKRNEPENWAKVKKILFAKDYVRHFFTGDYVTDYIEAEGSMMFDINKMEWSPELCGILGIKTEALPEIVNPSDIAGTVTEEAARITGLCEGTPVLCGTTDTVMEVFASGAVKKGQMTLKLATAGRICVVTDRPYRNANLVNYSHIAQGLFYPGTATKSCAASYRWFRDTFVWIDEICKQYGYDFEVSYAWAQMPTYEGKMSTQAWCEKKGITQCETIDELCEKSDYIMILAPANPETHLEYVSYYAASGKNGI